jgi:hypothetical protein
MVRMLLLVTMTLIAACGPTDRKESGAITSIAEDANQTVNAAKDAAAEAAEAARRIDEAARIQADGGEAPGSESPGS